MQVMNVPYLDQIVFHAQIVMEKFEEKNVISKLYILEVNYDQMLSTNVQIVVIMCLLKKS